MWEENFQNDTSHGVTYSFSTDLSVDVPCDISHKSYFFELSNLKFKANEKCMKICENEKVQVSY